MSQNKMNGRMFKVATRATLPIFIVAAMSAHAGIKYWDNPAFRAFDVGDYAPGAVWHFDGIRNVGADQPHSPTTTTWKNIGTTGSSNDVWIRYLNAAGNGWANSSAPASLGIVNGRNLGSWTENGFVFTGDSEWRAASPPALARAPTTRCRHSWTPRFPGRRETIPTSCPSTQPILHFI